MPERFVRKFKPEWRAASTRHGCMDLGMIDLAGLGTRLHMSGCAFPGAARLRMGTASDLKETKCDLLQLWLL